MPFVELSRSNIYECACDKFIENSADFDCQRQSLCNIYVIFFIGRFNLLRTVLEKNAPCMCFKQRVWLVKQSCKPRS